MKEVLFVSQVLLFCSVDLSRYAFFPAHNVFLFHFFFFLVYVWQDKIYKHKKKKKQER